MDKPRYVQRVKRGTKVYWRYNPPVKAIEAGVVERKYLNKRKETAFTEAERMNKKLDMWREERKQAQIGDPSKDKTIRGLFEFFKRSHDFQCLSEATAKTYEYQLNTACQMIIRNRELGSIRYKELTTPMAQELYDNLCKRGLTFANRTQAAVRRAFSVGVKFGLLDNNPFKAMDIRSEPERKVMWTHENLERVLTTAYRDFSTRNLGLIIHMAYEWAQRVGDMSNLKWDNLDLDNQVLTLTQSKRRAQVKIPISDELAELLRQQQEEFGWQEYVVPNVNSKREGGFNPYTPQVLSHAARRLIMRSGVPSELRISDLRRTATVEMAEAGVDMVQIMAVTGHANPQSVKPYLKNTLTSASSACKLRLSTRQVLHV